MGAAQDELAEAAVRRAVDTGFGHRADLAIRYAELLCTAGIERGLIGPREAGRIWGRHLFNSAALAPLIPAGAHVVDIGSGAGLPGIPVALARPDLHVVLLEPMARRVAFLQECVAALDLPQVEVAHRRAQDGLPAAAAVVARAVAALPVLAAMALPAGSGAELLALKGSSVATEAAELAAAGGYDVEVLEVTDPAGAPATVARVRATQRPRDGGSR
ncbi:MAG TPA: 16S rRNA (guanine(527)-N(7))-methyltransferase RsmG [Mycobacteriales bacterium]|nr:16S rRNA (guanine(527)-N(7))-methyltransferase RsmG [Mycobacteriales bacterium]